MNGQSGFAGFINQTQMASFGSFIGEIRITIISLMLAGADVFCLTRSSPAFQATGLALAGVLTTWLIAKSGVSAFTQKNVRETSREAYEGLAKVEEAKGKAGANPAVVADNVELVQVPANGGVVGAPVAEEHQWATGDDPRAGVL